jgi:hypothetical protein
MKRRLEDQGWSLSKHDSTTASNGKATSVVHHERGELIQFAQLSRDTTVVLELKKSLRELSLKINAAQQAERLRINEMLHAALGRSLALMSANLGVLALEPEAQEDGINYEAEKDVPAGAGIHAANSHLLRKRLCRGQSGRPGWGVLPATSENGVTNKYFQAFPVLGMARSSLTTPKNVASLKSPCRTMDKSLLSVASPFSIV